ncbi:hypothetical protein [Devosia sp.]|uniref:hypothetical protein n=1 Tax=Devosia sp. TaxID=1871048 RepID=UPI002EEBA1BC
MIASFSNNFIFIKTRKTAGTSIEIVLSAWCSGRDICTPISDADEALRATYGAAPRNHSRGLIARLLGRRDFYNHMPATEVRAALPALWSSAITFAVDRHPYEKVVSLAYFELGRRHGADRLSDELLSERISAVIAEKRYLNFPLYTEKGSVIVGELVPYAAAWKQVEDLARRIGREIPAELPRAKTQFRRDRRPAEAILTDRHMRQIRKDAAAEFDLFGWPEHSTGAATLEPIRA